MTRRRQPRKAKLPTKLRIAGQDFTVSLVTPHDALDHQNIGGCNVGLSSIVVAETIPEWRQRKVLLHELLHAAFSLFGKEDHEEADVLILEHGLWAIFNDNPGLARSLFGSNA